MNKYNDILKQFFNSADPEEKLGPNCFWNSLSVSFAFHKLDSLSFAFLNLGCTYSGPSLKTMLNDHDSKILWIYHFIEKSQYSSLFFELSSNDLDTISFPIILKLDLYELGKKYPAFPQLHEPHYLNLLGIEKGEKGKVRVIDRHFGFKGYIPYDLLQAASQSPYIKNSGEIFFLTPKDSIKNINFSIHQAFNSILYSKIDDYLNFGHQAVKKLQAEIHEIIQHFYTQYDSIQDAYRAFCQQINIHFTQWREGCLYYFQKYPNYFSDIVRDTNLVPIFLESTKCMRQIVFRIIMGELQNESFLSLTTELKPLLKKLVEIEDVLFLRLQTLQRQL